MTEAPIQVPFSREAEEGVLGSILIDPECLPEIELQPEDFYIHRNQWIYAACLELRSKAVAVDYKTLADRLEERGQLREAGGPAYLTALIQAVPTTLHVQAYAGIVAEKSRRRKLIALANEIVRAAFDCGEEIDPKIPEFMTKIVQTSGGSDHFEHISVALSDLYDEIDERSRHPAEMFGMATGVADFDKIAGGAVKCEMHVLSGQPGIGKSILACDFAKGLAKSGHPGAFAEMEMKNRQIVRRALSAEARVPSKALKTGNIQPDQWERITEGIDQLNGLPIYLSDSTRWTTASLRAELSRLKALFGIEWCVLDYFYLLKDKYGRDDNERTAMMSRNLKDIASELDLWLLVIHSMNKTGIAGETGLAALKGSGQIAYDADVAMMMTEKTEGSNLVRIVFEKFREDAELRGFNLARSKDFPTFGTPAKER